MIRNAVKLAVLVFVLATFAWVPAASALPGQCDDVCTCNSLCTQKCAVGGSVTNCGIGGICRDYWFAAAPAVDKADSKEAFLASLAQDEAEPVAETPALVPAR
jgi:hypothetical protein